MDPVSQGLVGAVFSGSASNKKELRKAAVIGFGAGMLADIDIFIRSSTDPLVALEYHRQFTHSLFFIPFGGLVAALVFALFFRKKLKFGKIYLYSVIGYATHCFLDACTSYGTELLWPFSNMKIGWGSISVLDPLFTVVLVIVVIWGFRKKSVNYSRIGIIFCISYILFGFYQHHRVEKFLLNAAALRGHNVEKILVHPTLGNLVLYRGIYESGGRYHVDAVRAGILSGEIMLYEGSSIKKFDPSSLYPAVETSSVLFNDIMRFDHFTRGFLVISPDSKDIIGDIRYSALPNSIRPLWGIKIDIDNPERHIERVNTFGVERDRSTLFKMLKGEKLQN